MRIALFHNLPSGGAKRHTHEQVRELHRRGYQIHEFTQSTAALDFIPLAHHVAETKVYDLPWRHLRPFPIPGVGPYVHLWQMWRNLSRLNGQARCIAADIDAGAFDLAFVKDCMFTIAPYVLRYLRTPSVFYMHTMPSRESYAQRGRTHQIPLKPLAQLVRLPSRLQEDMVHRARSLNLGSADRVLTNSHFTREVILLQDRVESHVVYPGVDVDVFRPCPSEAPGGYVLSVGALHPVKGHGFVMQAIGLLPETIRPRLVIAAATPDDGQEHRLRRLAKQHAVSVEIRSIQDSEEMGRLYSDALALAFAPTLEPLGLVSLEAMACGTPVVGVKEGGLRETIRDGVTGFLVDRDPAQFAAALQSLIEDAALRARLGQAARPYIEGYWKWGRAVDDLEAQFEALLRRA